MSTQWAADSGVAAGFEAYDDLPERVIGYPAVFSALRLAAGDVRRVLDYGCGPGKVALRVVQQFDVDVLAVDVAAAMLEIARRRRPHPRIDYQLLDGPGLPWLPQGSVDAAMACYVVINIADLDRIRAIAAEVHRVLRPGGRYALLDTNPDTTGITFSTFTSGEPGRAYRTGERRPVRLSLPDGGVLDLVDHHWPRQAYVDVLTVAGFEAVEVATPLLPAGRELRAPGQPDSGQVPTEALRPPFLLAVGVKR